MQVFLYAHSVTGFNAQRLAAARLPARRSSPSMSNAHPPSMVDSAVRNSKGPSIPPKPLSPRTPAPAFRSSSSPNAAVPNFSRNPTERAAPKLAAGSAVKPPSAKIFSSAGATLGAMAPSKPRPAQGAAAASGTRKPLTQPAAAAVNARKQGAAAAAKGGSYAAAYQARNPGKAASANQVSKQEEAAVKSKSVLAHDGMDLGRFKSDFLPPSSCPSLEPYTPAALLEDPGATACPPRSALSSRAPSLSIWLHESLSKEDSVCLPPCPAAAVLMQPTEVPRAAVPKTVSQVVNNSFAGPIPAPTPCNQILAPCSLDSRSLICPSEQCCDQAEQVKVSHFDCTPLLQGTKR